MNCPTCGKPIKWEDNPTRPFCSERCKLIDFGRWANEEYRVPVAEIPLAENEPAAKAREAAKHGPSLCPFVL
jgi:endogenous inhibitor of DNA gyrase (YacG/DUF329 family)